MIREVLRMNRVTSRTAAEPSHPFLDGRHAPPKRVNINVRGVTVSFRVSAGATWMSDMQALYLGTRNEELAEYGFKLTVFLGDSKEHLRHKITLTVVSDAGKHLNKRYDIDVSTMSQAQVESFASKSFDDLLDELDYVEQPDRVAAVTLIKRSLIDAGYNVNVPYPVSGGAHSLSCPFQVPGTGRVYVLRLQLKPPFAGGQNGYVCISEARTGFTVVNKSSGELDDLPKPEVLSKYVKRIISEFKSSGTVAGSTQALRVVEAAFALARRNAEVGLTQPIADVQDLAPRHVNAFNKKVYGFTLVVRDDAELRYTAQLGSKAITMSISDEMEPNQGYTVLLFPSSFDSFETERIKVKITKVDSASVQKAAEATVRRWVELFNRDIPPRHHLRVHGRSSGEAQLVHFKEVADLPKKLVISGKSFIFNYDVGIEHSDFGGGHTREWCYFTHHPKTGNVTTVDFTITNDPGLRPNLEVKVFDNTRKKTLGMFSRNDDSFDLKQIILHLENNYIKQDVVARTSPEPSRIREWSDLPKELTIFGKKFKRKIFNIEHVRGVKARWFDEHANQSLTWQYNSVQFRTHSRTRIPTFQFSVVKNPQASVGEFIETIERGVREKHG